MVKKIYGLSILVGVLVLAGAGCVSNDYSLSEPRPVNEFAKKFETKDPHQVELDKSRQEVKNIIKEKLKLKLDDKELEVIADRQTSKYVGGTVQAYENKDWHVYGQFLALVQENGGWNIVYAGAEPVPCKELAQYNFPRKILPQCFAPLTAAEIKDAEAQKVAHDKERITQVKALQVALEQYKKDKGSYPKSNMVYTLGTKEFSCLNKDGFGPKGCANAYMDNIKSDPTEDQLTGRYSYVSMKGTTYEIDLFLETNYSDSGLSLQPGLLQVTPKAFTGYDQGLQ